MGKEHHRENWKRYNDACAEGYAAYEVGLGVRDNPYSPRELLVGGPDQLLSPHHGWRHGWLNARRDATEAGECDPS